MSTDFYVYGLIDPRTHMPFYIGKGRGYRLEAHQYESVFHNKLTLNVMNKLKRLGLAYNTLIFINGLTDDQAKTTERWLIAIYGRRIDKTGILTNATNGGEGTNGFKHTDDTRKNLSIVRKQKYKEGYVNPGRGKKRPDLAARNRAGVKQVVQLDKNGQTIATWPSITSAAIHYGVTVSNITQNANTAESHPNRTIKGFKWRWV